MSQVEAKTAQDKTKSTQLSYKEYLARKEQAKTKEFKIPKAVQYVLIAPFLLLFVFGIFFIPFLMLTAKSVPAKAPTSEANR